jgi:hypothetical protein
MGNNVASLENIAEQVSNRNLSEYQLAIIELFADFDTDHSGILTGFEVANLIEAISQYIHHQTVQKFKIDKIRGWVYTTLDVNRDGRIEFSEFRDNLHKVLEPSLLKK